MRKNPQGSQLLELANAIDAALKANLCVFVSPIYGICTDPYDKDPVGISELRPDERKRFEQDKGRITRAEGIIRRLRDAFKNAKHELSEDEAVQAETDLEGFRVQLAGTWDDDNPCKRTPEADVRLSELSKRLRFRAASHGRQAVSPTPGMSSEDQEKLMRSILDEATPEQVDKQIARLFWRENLSQQKIAGKVHKSKKYVGEVIGRLNARLKAKGLRPKHRVTVAGVPSGESYRYNRTEINTADVDSKMPDQKLELNEIRGYLKQWSSLSEDDRKSVLTEYPEIERYLARGRKTGLEQVDEELESFQKPTENQ